MKWQCQLFNFHRHWAPRGTRLSAALPQDCQCSWDVKAGPMVTWVGHRHRSKWPCQSGPVTVSLLSLLIRFWVFLSFLFPDFLLLQVALVCWRGGITSVASSHSSSRVSNSQDLRYDKHEDISTFQDCSMNIGCYKIHMIVPPSCHTWWHGIMESWKCLAFCDVWFCWISFIQSPSSKDTARRRYEKKSLHSDANALQQWTFGGVSTSVVKVFFVWLLQLGPLGPFTHRAKFQRVSSHFLCIPVLQYCLFEYLSQATKWSFGHWQLFGKQGQRTNISKDVSWWLSRQSPEGSRDPWKSIGTISLPMQTCPACQRKASEFQGFDGLERFDPC